VPREGSLTLDGKLLKLIVLLQHAEMGERLIPLFWGLCQLGCVFCFGCCGRGGHVVWMTDFWEMGMVGRVRETCCCT
jgi:hypothetical protein